MSLDKSEVQAIINKYASIKQGELQNEHSTSSVSSISYFPYKKTFSDFCEEYGSLKNKRHTDTTDIAKGIVRGCMQGIGLEFYSFTETHIMLKQEAKAVIDAAKKR